MTVVGPLHYAAGESGQTRFLYEAGELECGRLEFGVIHKYANGQDTMLTWRVVNSGVDCATPPSPPPPPPPPPLVPDPCAGPWQYSGSNPFALPNSSDATIVEYVRAHVSSRLDGPIESDVQGTSWTSDGNYPVVVVKSSTQFWLHVNVTQGAVLPTSSTNQNGNARGSVTSIGLCVSSRADLIYKT